MDLTTMTHKSPASHSDSGNCYYRVWHSTPTNPFFMLLSPLPRHKIVCKSDPLCNLNLNVWRLTIQRNNENCLLELTDYRHVTACNMSTNFALIVRGVWNICCVIRNAVLLYQCFLSSCLFVCPVLSVFFHFFSFCCFLLVFFLYLYLYCIMFCLSGEINN